MDPRELREAMVTAQIERRGVRDRQVLAAMRRIPRERFVPPHLAAEAYADSPLPIGAGQTISQPYIVALMTEAAGIGPEARVLEVGTGCGYQTAVLATLAREVVSIERIAALQQEAAARLATLDLRNVTLLDGDGYAGAPALAPFDAILVTCAAHEVPAPLREQLATPGRLVVPVGAPDGPQRLLVVERTRAGEERVRELCGVRFVPLVRDAPRDEPRGG